MRTHISNIRDFCDGLEYQLQFNDLRVLEELEREGDRFLGLVHSCLRREERLRDEDGSAPMESESQLSEDSDIEGPPFTDSF